MVSKINCMTITGIDVVPVVVETDVCNGLPSFDMVGLLASDIKESRERVRTAVKNSGYLIPPKRITINFSPGNIRKNGTYFDVAVAVSILHALGIVTCDLSDKLFIGELSLNGELVKINGALPMILQAAEMGMKQCFIPVENLGECSFIQNIEVLGVRNLNEIVMILSGGHIYSEKVSLPDTKQGFLDDFKNVRGQELAKKAAEIAAAGMHNMLMVGPPGTGKTLIAKTMPSIMPDMTREEQIEISKIQSIAGVLDGGLAEHRPFRSPHHTTTVAAMIGGGVNPKPGEITLASGGILYMDEFPEFSRSAMETLRQPLEEGQIQISRTGGVYRFPAEFILLASMNPCRCGYYPDRNRCSCTEHDVKKYMEKVSGPIMDRIDLCTHMNPVGFHELQADGDSEDSMTIRRRVCAAVQIQRKRYQKESIRYNSELSGERLKRYCALGKEERELIQKIYEMFHLSVRGYEKLLKVSRTIADLKGKQDITAQDITEALTFRVQN